MSLLAHSSSEDLSSIQDLPEERNDDEIIVYVDKPETQFIVSKKQLQSILPHIELEGYESHYLPDVDKRTFELFEIWLCYKTLDSLNRYDEQEAKETLLEYLELYLKAIEWEIQDLEDHIMDHFRSRHTCEHGYFPCFLIKKIYDNTEEGAPLRRYIVNSFLFKSACWSIDALAESFSRHAEKGNTCFLLDCYKAALAFAEDRVANTDLDAGDLGCEYHNHGVGNECMLE